MRYFLVALALVGACVVAFLAACTNDSSSCTPGTLSLEITFSGTAGLAETITISDSDGLGVMQTFPHPASEINANFFVTVTWPNGYPADGLVHLVVRGSAGTTVLATANAVIRFGPTCTNGNVVLHSFATPDAAATD